MPEGDTIHTLAQTLRPHLEGHVLRDASLRERAGAEHLRGATVTAVEAVGKHLLVTVDSGHTLRVHLGMVGDWHRYAPGEAWRRPRGEAKVVLETDAVFVCFQPPTVDLFPTRERPTHPVLSALGPDLIAHAAPLADVLRRARAPHHANRPIAEVLLDQRVAAGIGNVIKCELLFIERTDPFAPVHVLSDERVTGLFGCGRRLLRANVGPGPRTTTLGRDGARPRARGSRLWVYERGKKPCFGCGTAVASRKAGDLPRWTWWCPRCQAPRGVGTTEP